MKKYALVILAIFAILAISATVSAVDFDDKTIQGLNVTSDIDAALNMSQNQNKTVVIVFDQDSCQYCDMFKKDVLSNPDVQKELNKKCAVVLVDINKQPDVANRYKVFGTPTTQFLDSHGNEIEKIEGYVDANEFLTKLKGI